MNTLVKEWNVESDPEWEFHEADSLGGCELKDLNDDEHECLEFECEPNYVFEENGKVVTLVRWCEECKNTERLIWVNKKETKEQETIK